MEKKQLSDSDVTEWLKLSDRKFKIIMIYMLRAKILKADNIRIDTCKKWDEYSKKESYWNARNQKHHTYINNPFQQLIRRLKIAEERINELKDRVIETFQIKNFPNVRGKKWTKK